MKKILVTGATGFIGSNLIKKLSKLNFKIYAAKRSPGTKSSFNNVQEIYLNLLDLKNIIKLNQNYKFDLIIHLGADINFDNKNKKKTFTINTLATKQLALLAKKMKAKFIFASTALIYGKDKKNINIKSRVCTDTYYALTKYKAEKILKSILHNVCILRFVGVYGLDYSNHLMLNKSIRDALFKKTAPILKHSLTAKRNYIYVMDVIKIIIRIISSNLSGTYLIASKKNLSIKSMLMNIYKIFLPQKKLLFIKQKEKVKVEDKIATSNINIGRETKFTSALIQIKKFSNL